MWLSFFVFVFMCLSFSCLSSALGDDVLYRLLSFMSVSFCLVSFPVSFYFSDRVPGLVCFDSVYVVVTIELFVVDQLM